MSRGRNRYNVLGDNPVLDVLHIAYTDLTNSEITELKVLETLITSNYKGYSQLKLRRLVTILVRNKEWFETAGNNHVHLTGKGVEVYLNMLQLYKAQKHAEAAEKYSREANRMVKIGIAVSIVSVIIASLGIVVQLITSKP